MKRKILAVLLALVVGFSFGACKKADEPAGDTKGGESQEADKSSGEKKTDEKDKSGDAAEPEKTSEIVFWYALSGSNGEVFNGLVDRFNEAQNKIKVEGVFSGKYAETAQKITAALASNTLPNGGVIPAGPIFTGANGNYKLLDYIENDSEFNMDDFYKGIWEYAKYEDKICVIPYNISTPLLYYNKDLMEQSGLDPDSPPTTWDELLEYAKAISKDTDNDGAIDVWGFDAKDVVWIFKSFLMQNECDIINIATKTPLFDTKEGIETAKFWDELVKSKAMPVGMHDASEDNFLGGLLGFYMGSSSRIGKWNGKTEFELGAAYLPKNKKYSVPIGGAVLALFPQNEEQDDATYEFIKWLVEPENLAEFCINTGYIPPRKAVLEREEVQKFIDEVPMYKTAFQQLEHASSYWHFNEMGTMDGFIWEGLEVIERETDSYEGAMKWISQKLKDEMEANK